jgi:hypothetical protein
MDNESENNEKNQNNESDFYIRLLEDSKKNKLLQYIQDEYDPCTVQDLYKTIEDNFQNATFIFQLSDIPPQDRSKLCAEAGVRGNIPLLDWLKNHGCPWDEWTCAWAARGGHLSTLQWLRKHDCPWDGLTSIIAAEYQHFDILQWAFSNNNKKSKFVCAYAAKSGRLDILEWAYNNGCSLDEDSCTLAAGGGHLHILQWLEQHNCYADEESSYRAAKEGQLETLKWLRERNRPWDEMTSYLAVSYNHLDVFKWIITNGGEWDKEIYEVMFDNKQWEFLIWMVEKVKLKNDKNQKSLYLLLLQSKSYYLSKRLITYFTIENQKALKNLMEEYEQTIECLNFLFIPREIKNLVLCYC